MAQPDLLENDPGLLLDDATGRIRYICDAVPREHAERWFAQLRDGIDWHAQRREMYGREVDVPRLTHHFRLDDPALPASLREAADAVCSLTRIDFNSIGLNFYRDGRDSVAPHNDRLEDLQRGFPIALLSLGSARRMAAQNIRRGAPCTSTWSPAACC